MLELRGVWAGYGPVRALGGVDLVVEPGTTVALLGRNGAGKTTAIGCFVDLVRPDRGSAEVDGVVVADRPLVARRALAYLPEHVALYPALTGRENVRFFAGLAGRRCSARDAAEALARFDLPPAAVDRPQRTYSKGMRQRVGLAIAVAGGARNLILDEPTSGLDPAAAHELMALLRAISREGTAVLASSHDLAHAARHADSLVCLRDGVVVAATRASAIDETRAVDWFSSLVAEAPAA
jgi:ABC-2 type transport system ATP-binding protein